MHRICRNRAALELFFLLAIALIFRVWVTVSIIGFNQIGLTSDDSEFESIGWTLAQVGRYAAHPDSPSTAHRSPMLPLLLAGIYSLVGHQRAVAQSVLIFISTLTVFITLLLGKEVGGRRVGVLAGLWVALDPFAWIFAGIFYGETLFTFAFVLIILFLLRVIKCPKRRDLVLLAVVLGFCVLTRPNGLLVALGSITLLPLAGGGRFKDWLYRAMSVSAIVVFLMTPWIGRNLLIFNRFIPTTSQTGEVLLGFYNEMCLEYRCNEWISISMLSNYMDYRLPDDEMARNDFQVKLALSSIRAHPIEWLALLPGKVVRFWTHDVLLPNTSYHSNPPLNFLVFQKAYYLFILLLSLAGLFILYFTRHRQVFIILASFLAIFSLMVLVLWGDARLRMPLHPLLAVAGAYALTTTYDNVFGRAKVQAYWGNKRQ